MTPTTPGYLRAATLEDARAHRLTDAEFDRVREILGREPNVTEVGIFGAMWSEHCSYKSSRAFFHHFPTTGPRVIQGPGENAGIVDIGDGWAVAFKMESHNHPSFIEPFQGAATGVGGILRDVFTMGARPIASCNSLRFGDPKHPRTRYLLDGVVRGIAFYGNCMGVPTVAGEVAYEACYGGNILVNAMTVGVVRTDSIFLGRAEGVGNPVIYVGSRTGRDGLGGATMASAEFDEDSEAKRPTVQVGDPFAEKLLLEACLDLFRTDAVVGIQDMGAAGLTSSTFEMASRAGSGIELHLDRIPVRADNLTPYELMLSESQERMLLVAARGREAEVIALFERWDLEAVVVGTVTDSGRAHLFWHGERVADIPVHPLAEEAPRYERPRRRPRYLDDTEPFDPGVIDEPADPGRALADLLAHPNFASKAWVWRQYDHMVGASTVVRPGGDAAVVRVPGTDKGLAMTVDCSSRLVYLDPYRGAYSAVMEGARNVSCHGAEPLAITDCLNFGSPENPEILWQFEQAVRGIGDACRALGIAVVSGNVSFYNETQGQAIWPTPSVGLVGLLDDVRATAQPGLAGDGLAIVLLGPPGAGHLGASAYVQHAHGLLRGRPAPIDTEAELAVQRLVRGLVRDGVVSTAHDVSDGGLGIALAELTLVGDTRRGLRARLPGTGSLAGRLFGEDPSRVLVAVAPSRLDEALDRARRGSVPAEAIGTSGGARFAIEGVLEVDLADLAEAFDHGFARSVGIG